MRWRRLAATCGLLAATALGCTKEGDRVLIVVNEDSPISLAIGARYAELRGVPDTNLVRLSLDTPDPALATDTHETMPLDHYRALVRDPIRKHLQRNELEERIDYIVTTKGVPLRIEGLAGSGRFDAVLRDATRASLDSELMLLFSGGDGEPGAVPNPYFGAEVPIREFRENRAEAAPRYLVARLTGTLGAQDPRDGVPMTVERLLRVAREDADERATWLLDGDPEQVEPFQAANQLLTHAADTLRALGVPVVHKREARFAALAGEDRHIQGYASWGSNDRNAPDAPYYGRIGGVLYPGRFAARSIAMDFVSTSARSFTRPARYGQSLVSDLLELGAAGVGGHVYEPTLSTVPHPDRFFARYARGATAAEAYWSSVPTLGWMHTYIGDPLMRLEADYATPSEDRDGDGVPDASDNCIDDPNRQQRDTDSDGYGNFCDADINNDGLVTTSWGEIFPLGERGDIEWIGLTIRSGVYDENHDLDGDGRVGSLDLARAQIQLYQSPGPSASRPAGQER